ncbi:type II secretion system secretin GspD [Acidovorax sp. NB1]|uniref:type II secretion system secretin GspD n=1 Tax=Acidovorax sp. NB1 TaxID=1943571 RepID=UPI0010F7010A|nr:type II secretion system secretin GspD [Acidovorax sp. NB1]
MTLSKHILPLALAAACQASQAQSVTSPEQPPRDAQPSVEAETLGSNGEPRIMRGNDRVIAPVKAASPLGGAPISFNFEDAPIAEVVRTILGDLLKVDYVIYPPISGTVTLATRTPVAPDKAVFLLESALAVNGLALVGDTRGSYHVGRAEALRNISSGIRQAGPVAMPPGSGPIIVPLQYIGAAEMATILRPMMPPDSLVRVDSLRNLLVLAGTRSQAEGWLDIVNTFDVDLLKGMSVGVFPLKYASVSEVEAALRLIGSAGTSAPGSAAARPGTPTASTATTRSTPGTAASATNSPAVGLGDNNPLFGALRVLPIERINSILVVTPKAAYLDEARRWIERFDRPSDGGAEPQLYIYRVQNGNARHLAGVLQGIFGGGAVGGSSANSGVAPGLTPVTGATSGYSFAGGGMTGNNAFQNNAGARSSGLLGGSAFGNGLGSGANSSAFGARAQQGTVGAGQQVQPITAAIGNIRVMSDDLNNSILIWGTRGEFEKIETTLKRLDTPPTQVLIEASIIEVTLNDNLNYGLQWAFDGGVGNNYQGAGQISSGSGAVTSGTGSLGTAMAQGFTYSLVNSAGKIRMALNALSRKTTIKMISNPSLMVLDNHLAMMTVGNQVPVLSSTTDWLNSSNATTSTVQYRDTGVSLAVTPSVNSGNLVSMQIDQTVTDVSDTTSTSANNQPTFMQRQISSKVAVRSGEAIVLGGLIKDNETRGKNGVPLLQDLPLVGNLFGTNSRAGARTELLVVITPKVVRSDIDVREVSEDLRDRMKGLLSIESVPPRADGIPTPQAPATPAAAPSPR